MAVLGAREVLPRTYEHRLGGSPTATRNFVCTLDAPTSAAEILLAVGVGVGVPHPEHVALRCESVAIDEPDRHHATVSASYAVPDPEDNPDPNQPPWIQPDSWSFSTSSGSIALTYYYPTAGDNATTRALKNSAGDVITGLTRPETEIKITISGARQFVDLREMKRIANTTNSLPWLGFPKHTVLCVGVSATPQRIEQNDIVLDFWQINVELVYRPSSHDLFLPNVGWNVIVNGKKERAWTYVSADGAREKVPTPEKVSLNLDGGFLCGPEQDDAANADGGTTVDAEYL